MVHHIVRKCFKINNKQKRRKEIRTLSTVHSVAANMSPSIPKFLAIENDLDPISRRTAFAVCCSGAVMVASGPTEAEKSPRAAPSPNPSTPLRVALNVQLSMTRSILTSSLDLMV